MLIHGACEFADSSDSDPEPRYRASEPAYWTVLIPWASDKPTVWHPTEREGPFSVLSRGAFATEHSAREWAEYNLGRHTYSLKEIKDDETG